MMATTTAVVIAMIAISDGIFLAYAISARRAERRRQQGLERLLKLAAGAERAIEEAKLEIDKVLSLRERLEERAAVRLN